MQLQVFPLVHPGAESVHNLRFSSNGGPLPQIDRIV